MNDRPAAIRAAIRTVVARHGFHGASMAAIADEAGVAVGTAYVHYPSKDELVIAAYLEVKRELGEAATVAIDSSAPAPERFAQLWRSAHRYFVHHPDHARFVVQFDAGPYGPEGHERAMAVVDDPLVAEAALPDIAVLLIDLPPLVLYDLGLAPAARAVANGVRLDDDTVTTLAAACWRAITSR